MRKSRWSDEERIRLFVSEARALNEMRLLKNKELRFGVRVEGGGITLDARRYDFLSSERYGIEDEDLRAFLTRLRPFLRSHEPVSLEKMYRLALEKVNDSEIVPLIVKSKDQWRQSRQDRLLRFTVGGKDVAKQEIMDWFLTAIYFHHDPDKRKKLERLPTAFRDIMFFEFICEILSAASHVIWVGTNLSVALDRGAITRDSTAAC
jgi:hypothetical protein